MRCSTKEQSLGPTSINRASLHVLVVVHGSTKHVLVEMLGRVGHQVIPATDGTEAETAAKFQRFDLLISDIGLPGINGWDLLGKLRRNSRTSARLRRRATASPMT